MLCASLIIRQEELSLDDEGSLHCCWPVSYSTAFKGCLIAQARQRSPRIYNKPTLKRFDAPIVTEVAGCFPCVLFQDSNSEIKVIKFVLGLN